MSSFIKGGMYILSSPSGAGKTTLVKKISSNQKFITSISHTTRFPRPNEKDGKDYFFISKKKFKNLIKKRKFLEHAKVFRNYYGSSKDFVINNLNKGNNVIFDIDWQGTQKIKKKKLKFKLFTIFILPPSKKELIRRLTKRENKNLNTVHQRMRQFKKDLLKWREYNYVVINDDLNKCYNKIMRAIKSKNANFNKMFIRNHIAKLLT